MARILVQRGHCFRRSGATGTHREQEFTSAIGTELVARLRELGHDVSLLNADDDLPKRGDAFVALHCDGSSNRARRGASVGYPDRRGGQLAAVWKEEHARAGFPGGFLADNYTTGLSNYYGYRRTACTFEFLAEHGTTTNAADETWIAENVKAIAEGHVRALGRVLGHPRPDGGGPPQLRVLGLGDTGDDVRWVQEQLLRFGYELTVDGDFGPVTDAAVRRFQACQDLEVDGLVGKQTRATLQDDPNPYAWLIGEIRAKWESLAPVVKEAFGPPTTRELRCPDGRGRYNHFAGNASIYWTPQHGAFEVHGNIRLAWERVGWERGTGYPVSDELLVDGRAVARFERSRLTCDLATGWVREDRQVWP